MSKTTNRKTFFNLLLSYLFLFGVFSLFSFVFSDPNLTLINNQFFMNWQQFLWSKVLPNLYLRIGIYFALICLLSLNYYYLIKFWPKKTTLLNKKIFFSFLALSLILIFTYNALSHDLFNYIFNARMLIKYRVDPHQLPAINFADDHWSRFMHNIHTPAPYGKIWTLISALPYYFGFGKFLITWLNFKAFALLGMFLALIFINKLINANSSISAVKNKRDTSKLALLFLNPLLLIESIANAHNDWWMMWPVLGSFLLARKFKTSKKKNYFILILIMLLMAFSIFTKFASLVAIIFLIYYLLEKGVDRLTIFKNKFIRKLKKLIDDYFWDLVSIAFFLPLFTTRSQRFLTWYLIWPMTFLPLVKSKWWQTNLLLFSISSLFSYLVWIAYIPWLNFDRTLPNLLFYKQLILWFPAIIFNIFFIVKTVREHAQTKI